MFSRYRSSGADLPFGDPLPYHGVAMEGYFWRFTDRSSGSVVVALCGVNRSATGTWATVALCSWPDGYIREAVVPFASADPDALGAFAGRQAASIGESFAGTDRVVHVDLGPDAQLDVQIEQHARWKRRSFGGSSIFQSVPALNQYWHPHLLGGRATGTAQLGGRTLHLEGAAAYAEKNWGRGGFPPAWWWGQAQGFEREDVCIAFAGGVIEPGPFSLEVTALVARVGRDVVRLGDPLVSPVRAEISNDRWQVAGRGRGWEIEVDGHAPLGAAHVLPVPLPAERRNVPGALEHLGGTLDAEIRHRGRTVFSGRSRLAALEHGGLDRAQHELARRGGSAAPQQLEVKQ